MTEGTRPPLRAQLREQISAGHKQSGSSLSVSRPACKEESPSKPLTFVMHRRGREVAISCFGPMASQLESHVIARLRIPWVATPSVRRALRDSRPLRLHCSSDLHNGSLVHRARLSVQLRSLTCNCTLTYVRRGTSLASAPIYPSSPASPAAGTRSAA